MCDKGFIWNASNWECEFDKACDVGEYLDYENCKCRRKLVDKLVDECEYSSCTVYIVLFSISFTVNVGIVIYFVYSRWYLKKDVLHTDLPIQTTIY